MARPQRMEYWQLERIGWILYLVSWLTPSLDGSQLGARAFVMAVEKGVALVLHTGSSAGISVGICLLFGWLANFSIILPWRPRARVVWIAAPWVPFAALLIARPAPSPLPLLYFYPWAIGIGLIHAAAIADASSHRRAT